MNSFLSTPISSISAAARFTLEGVSVVIPNATLYIPFAELVDLAKEIERLEKEEKRLEPHLVAKVAIIPKKWKSFVVLKCF